MSIRSRKKKDGTLSYQVRVKPFKAKTAPTWKTAKVIEADLERRRALGDLYVEAPTTLGAEMDGYLDRKARTHKRKAPTIRYDERNRKFWHPLDDRLVPQLRRGEVEDIFSTRAAQHPRSANNELSFLKAVLHEAEARGQRADRNIYEIKPVKYRPKRGVALTYDELLELASHAPDYISRMILVAGTSSVRWWALVNMEDSWIDFKKAQVTIPAEFIKTNRVTVIPLTPQEIQWLREQLLVRCKGTSLVFPRLHGTSWKTHSGFHKAVWKAATTKAELPGFRFNWLRHTATTLMFDSGMPPHIVGARRGDADGGYEAWKTYCHPGKEHIGEAMEEFAKWLAPKEQRMEAHGE